MVRRPILKEREKKYYHVVYKLCFTKINQIPLTLKFMMFNEADNPFFFPDWDAYICRVSSDSVLNVKGLKKENFTWFINASSIMLQFVCLLKFFHIYLLIQKWTLVLHGCLLHLLRWHLNYVFFSSVFIFIGCVSEQIYRDWWVSTVRSTGWYRKLSV